MSTGTRERNIFIFTCLVVPVVLLCLFVLYPMMDLFALSFQEWDGIQPQRKFVGLNNYLEIFRNSPTLWKSLQNNIIYFAVSLLFIPVELMLASIFNTKFLGSKFFKSVVFLPYILNGVAVSYAFAYFLSPINGGLNTVLTMAGLEGFIRSWLSDTSIVNIVLALIVVWRFSGYHIILFSAAMHSVPTDHIEAAKLDGANAFQIFTKIQLPSIKLVIEFIIFTTIIGSLQQFDIPFVMTGGGPNNATSTFTLYSVNTAFTYKDFGMAAAMAVIMVIIIVIILYIQNVALKKVQERKERRLVKLSTKGVGKEIC